MVWFSMVLCRTADSRSKLDVAGGYCYLRRPLEALATRGEANEARNSFEWFIFLWPQVLRDISDAKSLPLGTATSRCRT